jgi:hypothetical protein
MAEMDGGQAAKIVIGVFRFRARRDLERSH